MNITPSMLRRVALSCVALPCVALGVIACGGDNVVGPTVRGEDLFWAVEANHRSVTIQTGQQLQIQAQGITPLGQPIPELASRATYFSTDTMRVKITSTGLMTAHATGNGVLVVATIHSDAQNVTNADTIRVNVVAAGTTVQSFAIQSDSALIAAGSSRSLRAVTLNTVGDTVRDVAVRYYSADPKALAVNTLTGALTPRTLGPVKVWAVATIFGTTWTDTVTMTVTAPVSAGVSVSNLTFNNLNTPLYFSATDLTVRKGAVVRFTLRTTVPIDITFDNPAGVVGGNIALPGTMNAFQDRTFNTVGTFTFQSPQFTGTGKITVVP